MPEHSSMHFYLNWTKERLDEMDATLASLEANTRLGQNRLNAARKEPGQTTTRAVDIRAEARRTAP
jgi:hypothetical protein